MTADKVDLITQTRQRGIVSTPRDLPAGNELYSSRVEILVSLAGE